MKQKNQTELDVWWKRGWGKTFWEGYGLCCCQPTGPVSEGSEGSGEVGVERGRMERGTCPWGEEALHAPGSPPSETAGCQSPSFCLLHCRQNQCCEMPGTSRSTVSTLRLLVLQSFYRFYWVLLQEFKPTKSICERWLLPSFFLSAPLWTEPGPWEIPTHWLHWVSATSASHLALTRAGTAGPAES